MIWWIVGAAVWLACGALAYAIEFGWWVALTESYPDAYDDKMLYDQLCYYRRMALTTGLVGGPLVLFVFASASRAVQLPIKQRLCWRNPATAMLTIRALQHADQR